MAITGHLIGQFAGSIAPIYFTFMVGVVYCFTDILVLDFVPAISVIIQYVGLPALLFLRIAENKISALDVPLLGADALSKLIPFVIMLVWWKFFSKYGKIESIEWVITMWMLATLPNTVLIGDQILTPMFEKPYGPSDPTDEALWTESKTTTIIFAQSLYWYNFVILIMEIREMFLEDERLLAQAMQVNDPERQGTIPEGGEQLKNVSPYPVGMDKSRQSWEMGTPDIGTMMDPQSWAEQVKAAEARRPSWEMGRPKWSRGPYDGELTDFSIGSMTPTAMTPVSRLMTPSRMFGTTPRRDFNTPGRHMMTPGSMIGTPSHIVTPSRLMTPSRMMTPSPGHETPVYPVDDYTQSGSIHSTDISKNLGPEFYPQKPAGSPIAPEVEQPNFVTKMGQTLIRVAKRMLQVPLLYGSALGFIWSINKWRVPSWMYYSLYYCADGTIGLAMILLGMVCVKNIKGARGWIPCGWKLLWAGFIARFLFGPIVMYICALAFNLKGPILYYAIIQVIVPQGSMTFALAQIYGVKLEVITPAIYIQMIVFVPIILAYYAGLQSFYKF